MQNVCLGPYASIPVTDTKLFLPACALWDRKTRVQHSHAMRGLRKRLSPHPHRHQSRGADNGPGADPSDRPGLSRLNTPTACGLSTVGQKFCPPSGDGKRWALSLMPCLHFFPLLVQPPPRHRASFQPRSLRNIWVGASDIMFAHRVTGERVHLTPSGVPGNFLGVTYTSAPASMPAYHGPPFDNMTAHMSQIPRACHLPASCLPPLALGDLPSCAKRAGRMPEGTAGVTGLSPRN